ncbi:MAG TPA: AAA family ATPase [Candidatus Didemnitutus sp.]|nr:AAA family ATPase [Candidatus Didemnitutus sp.]
MIGARGSGKTALVDLIAAGAQALPAKLSDSSFLKRATSEQDLIGNARVEETWGNGEKRESNFGPAEYDFIEPEPEVRYLSQQFVDDLCSASGIATALREEIERVIFDQTEKTQRYDTASFSALASLSLEPILFRRRELADSIADFSKEIAAEERWIEQLKGLKEQHAKLKAVIVNRKIELGKLLPKGMEARTKRLLALDEACTAAESRIETLNKRLRAIENLRAALDLETKTEEPSRFSKLQRQYADAGLTAPQWQTLKRVYAGDTGAALDASKSEATAAIGLIENGDPTKPVNIAVAPIPDWHLVALRTEREKVKKEVGIDGEQQRKYDLLTKTIATEDAQLKTLAANVATAEGAKVRKEALIQSRRDTFQSLFETYLDEAAALATLYGPLHDQLKGATGALARLRFTVKRMIDLPKWLEAGKELLDLRKTTIFDPQPAGQASIFAPLEAAWRTGSAAEVAAAMAVFFEKQGPTIVKAMPGTVEIDDRIDWRRQLGEWLFSLDHVSIEYALEYDGTNVEQLSPGTRGIVLLLLYLAVDRNDPRPLLIDQPEENLDPKSVFEDLVPHFREARKRRQVIIVTHNANLVVNTDADQVIVARSSRAAGGGLPDIEYTMGSLENDTIRHAVCDILEGGKRAFIERERRYRLQWERMLEEDAPATKPAPVAQPVRPVVDRVDLYFAYGSNLSREQMADRCKDHKVLGRATLPDYNWIINRRAVANIVTGQGIVEGTLYRLSVKDEARLDELEGVAAGSYRKKYLDVQWAGKTVRALVYIDPITELGKASAAYAAILTQGSLDAGLPKEYFDGVIRPFLPDPDIIEFDDEFPP